MPANNPKASAQMPASPRSTAKYSNKDGSKFITVPKGAQSDSSQPSTPTTTKAVDLLLPSAPMLDDEAVRPVNRKKQKRRQKAAAKAAAEQAANGDLASAEAAQLQGSDVVDLDDLASEDEQDDLLADDGSQAADGDPLAESKSKKSKKKKKKRSGAVNIAGPPLSPSRSQSQHSNPDPRGSGISRDKIWSTSNHEERERIKEFWLGLGEDERKSLVKVEKDAVLKKMKEQQKHTCSCTVCGRKRNAIEEELEGLYDAYYLELEQFANQGEGPPMLPPPRDFPIRPPRRLPSGYAGQPPSRGRIVEHVGDDEDEDLEEVYSEDEVEDDEYSDDEPPEDYHTAHDRDVADFLTFGNSLQVKGTQLLELLLSRYGNMDLGGILTVADDLLKNDGKRFIEMMEQLAERRMAREEDAREHFSRSYGHPNGSYSTPHNHPPIEDDEYDEEEDDEEDYDDSQDEEYEDEEVYSNPSAMPSMFHTECCCQDQMTEEQRMEEGRRMFQIFAARMFEQRVLSAYKEKVAKERQQKLLEELDEETRQVDQQKAKKAKSAQKKKDKAAQKKQVQAEEKARKDAEKAAEEAARLEEEQRRAAEQKMKAEEKRKQKEAQRKAEEDARLKKEADRQRRIHEQREKQAEQERKAREAKDREKKLKEELRLKEKEARDQKEREAQERKDKQERDKRDKEARAAKAYKEAQEAREARDKAREDKIPKHPAHAGQLQPISTLKRGQQHPVLVPTVLPQHPPNPAAASYASPKIPVATPAISKGPTPIRSRQASQQESGPASSSASQSASLPSQLPSPNLSFPAPVPASTFTGQQRKESFSVSAAAMPPASHSVSPPTDSSKGPSQPALYQVHPPSMQPPPGLAHQPPPGFGNRMPLEAVFPPVFRPGHNTMGPPPGINGPPARGFPPVAVGPPSFPQAGNDQFPGQQAFPMPKDAPVPTHARQGSTGFESATTVPAQPIGRPAPIGRPGSTVQGRSFDADENTKHLGSRALLEDDEPLPTDLPGGSLRSQPSSLRSGFAPSPFIDSGFALGHNPWGPPSGGSHGFPPPGFAGAGWGGPAAPPGFSVGSPHPVMASVRPNAQPRHVALRQMLCQACKDISSSGNTDHEGFMDLGAIRSQITSQSGDATISEQDLMDLCDTEGSASNGGGSFDVRHNAAGPGKNMIRWVPDVVDSINPQYRAVGAPGEIGSPLTSQASLRGI